MSLKDKILKAEDLPREPVDVREWGVTVWVRTMTAAERDQWERVMAEAKRLSLPVSVRANLAARCIVDETGARVFDDADVTQLATKSARALDRIIDVAMRLNGIGTSDVEELEKN